MSARELDAIGAAAWLWLVIAHASGRDAAVRVLLGGTVAAQFSAVLVRHENCGLLFNIFCMEIDC